MALEMSVRPVATCRRAEAVGKVARVFPNARADFLSNPFQKRRVPAQAPLLIGGDQLPALRENDPGVGWNGRFAANFHAGASAPERVALENAA